MPLTESVPNLLIHIPQVVVQLPLAESHLAPNPLSPSLDTTTSKLPSLPFNLLTMLPQYPSVLMLPLGLHTLEVSSLIAQPQSIMPSYLLDILALIG
jgi:hypothetical protein